MDTETFVTGTPLGTVVRLAGALFTAGISIYVLIRRKPPAIISSHPMFSHMRGLVGVLIGVFLSLTWGLLGNTAASRPLAGIAASATLLGFLAFFWVARLVEAVPGSGATHARNPTFLLFSYVVYSVLISWGLTAATIFLSVMLLNPANPAAVAIATESAYAFEIRVDGTVDTQSDVDVPFRVSSGQINFGCGDTRTLNVSFPLPQSSSFVGTPVARVENSANSSSGAPAVKIDGARAIGTVGIRGLDYQEFGFGIRNCPGGGHGELVMTGTYRTTTTQTDERSVSLVSGISSSVPGPVVVSLPTEGEMSISSITIDVARELPSETKLDTFVLTHDMPSRVLADAGLLVSFDAQRRELRFEWAE